MSVFIFNHSGSEDYPITVLCLVTIVKQKLEDNKKVEDDGGHNQISDPVDAVHPKP